MAYYKGMRVISADMDSFAEEISKECEIKKFFSDSTLCKNYLIKVIPDGDYSKKLILCKDDKSEACIEDTSNSCYFYDDYKRGEFMSELNRCFGIHYRKWQAENMDAKKKLKMEKEIAKLQQLVDTMIDMYYDLLSNNFPIMPCDKCDSNKFDIIKFNDRYTGIQLSCVCCKTKSWVKILDNSPKNIEDIKNYYLAFNAIKRHDENSFILKEIDRNHFIRDYKIKITEYYIKADESRDEEHNRKAISSYVRNQVWNRDGGKCVECGSKELLEFDHIVPFSRGGSNSARNLQLLCEKCNRKKHNKIQ